MEEKETVVKKTAGRPKKEVASKKVENSSGSKNASKKTDVEKTAKAKETKKLEAPKSTKTKEVKMSTATKAKKTKPVKKEKKTVEEDIKAEIQNAVDENQAKEELASTENLESVENAQNQEDVVFNEIQDEEGKQNGLDEDENQNSVDNNENLDENIEEAKIQEEIKADRKKEKTKKEKKEKKKLTKKQKFMIIFFTSLAFVLALGTTIGILYYKKISTKLELPIFAVYQRESGTIISVEKNTSAVAYEFVVTNGENEQAFTSKENMIELKSYLNEPGEHSVKVRLLGKVKKAHSDFTEVQTFVYNKPIATPDVSQSGNTLFWQPVAHAEGYKVYFGANITSTELQQIDISKTPNASGLITFNLEELDSYGVGEYTICINAIGNESEYYLNSDFSNSFNYTYTETLENVSSAKYNVSTKVLTVLCENSATIPERFVVEVTYVKLGADDENVITYNVDVSDLVFSTEEVAEVIYKKYIINFQEVSDRVVYSMKIKSSSPSNAYILDSNFVNVQ